MERIYTPWRMSYITDFVKDQEKQEQEAKMSGEKINKATCVFCEMINETKENDPKNLILYRAENTFIVLNRFPYNSGHLMILPNIHEGDLTCLNAEIQAEMMHLTSFAVNFLREEYKPHGFNLGINMGEIAGGSISPHLHIHVVPRWAGDTNFMPTIGETKVLPEDLGQTHARLSGRIKKISVPS